MGRSQILEQKTAARVVFEEQIQLAWDGMFRRATKAVGRDAAEDLVMSAFAEALANPNWETVAKPHFWMLGCIDFQIKRHRSKTVIVSLEDESAAGYCADFAPDLIDQMAHDQEVKNKIDSIMAMAFLAGLNRRENFVFLARLRGDRSYKVIGKTLGISEKSAAAYHSQAVKKIRAVADHGEAI